MSTSRGETNEQAGYYAKPGRSKLAQAAKVMGSEELEQKFELALTKVRRDLVAAQSLYL